MKSSKAALLFSLLLVGTFCFAQHEDSELASRVDQIMQVRSADGDFTGTIFVVIGRRVA